MEITHNLSIRSGALLMAILLLPIITPALMVSSAAVITCEHAVHVLNQQLDPQIDERELAAILHTLNETGNTKLPPQFVTKEQARDLGWKPGRNLWAIKKLRGKSLGGDIFENRGKKLPDGRRIWHEADLDYQGGHRGPKRLIYSNDGLRMVTVNHYTSFKEIQPCQ
jgi:ribonuclease T1